LRQWPLHRDKIRVAVRSHIRDAAIVRNWVGADPADDHVGGVPASTVPGVDGGTLTWAVVDA
jgi:hypothetical protein